MVGTLQPLADKFPIIGPDGKPTPYFIRWAQQRQEDIGQAVTAEQVNELISAFVAEHQIQAGSAVSISPSGNLENDPTVSYNGGLSDQNDVDLSTPPTNGQVLTWVSADNKWEPRTPSGGGGGGGNPAPTIVQRASIRNDGTVTLPGTPSVGNWMVWIAAGWGGSLLSYIPSGFSVNWIYFSNNNNAVMIASREVQSGDTGSYAVSASDNQGGVLLELSGFKGIAPIIGGPDPFFNGGTSYSHFVPPTPYEALIIVARESDDAATWTTTAATGLTEEYNSGSGTGNHTGVILSLDMATFQGAVSGSCSSVNNNVYGIWGMFG